MLWSSQSLPERQHLATQSDRVSGHHRIWWHQGWCAALTIWASPLLAPPSYADPAEIVLNRFGDKIG